MIRTFEDVQALGKENLEAYQASAAALTRGFQAFAAETAQYSKKVFEKGAEAAERLAATRSPDKLLEVQQAYAREAFEGFVGQASKLGELYLATAKEVYRPFEAKFAQFDTKSPQ